MNFKTTIATLIACQFALLPSLAQAQSSEFDRAFAPQAAEVRLSFTIPLGNSSQKSKTVPRLGFAVRNYEQSASPSRDWMLADPKPFRETQLGFTLEETPKLIMNDQILILNEDEQANIGTAGKIGIGAVAVVLVVAAVAAIVLVSCDGDGECLSSQ